MRHRLPEIIVFGNQKSSPMVIASLIYDATKKLQITGNVFGRVPVALNGEWDME
jgi:hypothetical protein